MIVRSDIGDFLRRYPRFSFNIHAQVRAALYEPYLRTRLDAFQLSLCERPSVFLTQDEIVASVRERFSISIPKLQAYAGAEHFEELPFCSKNDLRSTPFGFCDLVRDRIWKKETSGTTGRPVSCFYSEQFYFEQLFLDARKAAKRASIETGRREVFLLTLVNNPSMPQTVIADPLHEVGIFARLAVDERNAYQGVFDSIQLIQPEVLAATPTQLGALLDAWPHSGWRLQNPPAMIISSGSYLPNALRMQLEERFCAPVRSVYAMSEVGMVASECSHTSGLHVDISSMFVELVDEVGCRVSDGCEGEISVSSSLNDAMPMIRYRTGDLGFVDNALCACGHGGVRIQQFTGRRVPHFIFDGKRLFDPTRLHHVLFQFQGIEEYQITQLSWKCIELRMCWPKVDETLFSALLAKVRELIPGDIDLVVVHDDLLGAARFERYRSFVKADGLE